jgi:hypothetical protein
MITTPADYFAESIHDATRPYNHRELRIPSKPRCVESLPTSSKSLDGDKGIQVDGLAIQVNADRGQGGDA